MKTRVAPAIAPPVSCWVKLKNMSLKINKPLTLWIIKYFRIIISFKKNILWDKRGINKTTLSSILIQHEKTDTAPALHHRFLRIIQVNNNFDH